MDAANEKGSPKQLRVRSLGTRLSEAEYAQCEKSAARRGLTTGEWCRQVLLEAAVASPAQEPEAEVILSEILALRKIVINLLYGEKAGAPLSEERMRELIETADSEKLRKAAERLRAVRTARAGVLSDDEPRGSVRKSGTGALPGGHPGELVSGVWPDDRRAAGSQSGAHPQRLGAICESGAAES